MCAYLFESCIDLAKHAAVTVKLLKVAVAVTRNTRRIRI
jgi:hypothetical protein